MKNRISHHLNIPEWKKASDKEVLFQDVWSCGSPDWQADAPAEATLSLVQEIAERLKGTRSENFALRKRIDDLAKRVDRHEQLLKEILDPVDLPPLGSFEQWLSSPDAIVHAGKHVAFVEGEGVIASANSLDELFACLETKKTSSSPIIGFVPAAGASLPNVEGTLSKSPV